MTKTKMKMISLSLFPPSERIIANKIQSINGPHKSPLYSYFILLQFLNSFSMLAVVLGINTYSNLFNILLKSLLIVFAIGSSRVS